MKNITLEKSLLLVGTFVSIFGFTLAYIQLNNIQKTTSASLALELYKDTRSDRLFKNNPKIISAIYSDEKILRENGGNFSSDDLDDYLGLFEWIGAANDTGVISDDMVYEFHSDLIENTWRNQEVRN